MKGRGTFETRCGRVGQACLNRRGGLFALGERAHRDDAFRRTKMCQLPCCILPGASIGAYDKDVCPANVMEASSKESNKPLEVEESKKAAMTKEKHLF